MPVFYCDKHKKRMYEELVDNLIVPYCFDCKVEMVYKERLDLYNQNFEDYNKRNQKEKRKNLFKHLIIVTLGASFIITPIISVILILLKQENIALNLGIGIALGLLISKLSFHYEPYYKEPQLEEVKKSLSYLQYTGSAVEKYKKKLHEDYLTMTLGLNEIDEMKGVDFERYIANLISKIGFHSIQVTKQSGDGGVDVLAKSESNEKVAIQCKRMKGKVGNSAIQEVFLGKRLNKCKRAIVVTNSYFTKPAILSAMESKVELWDRDYLINILNSIKKSDSWDDYLDRFYKKPS